MSIPELLYRIRETVKKKLDKRFKANYTPTGKINTFPKSILFTPDLTDTISTGTYSIFGNTLKYNAPVNWHYDIMNDKTFPLDHSFSIDTRSGKHGNVKVVWEVNRLQFLTEICLKYKQTGDQEFLNQFMSIIESWQKQNPYLKGVNWYSNIEVNIRIINWFVCWEILQANQLITSNSSFKQFTETVWLPLIELHGMHGYRYESNFSSSNNHLIAEGSGLFIVGSYWSFNNASKWKKKGAKILEIEIKKQHSKNGINKEEASEYIQFITDFFLIAYIVGERTDHAFSEAYKTILEKIFSYINTLMDISGNVPYYGDDDDGKVLSLNVNTQTNNFQSLLTSAAVLFKDRKFKRKGNEFDLKNTILFGDKAALDFSKLQNKINEVETKLYKDEGHFFIKKGKDENEIYLHVDVAPLGYLSIAAHGHADALSFFLNVDGKPYIIDPGTYTYHSYPIWRAYFKGTLAHNTIRVDGIDQATNSGPCLWTDHYSIKQLEVLENTEVVTVKGSHTGYNKLGVTHIRSYTFNKVTDSILIHDEIITTDNKMHTYEIPLHLHPEISCTQIETNVYNIKHSTKRNVTITIDTCLNTEIVRGAKKPLLGWYSPSFLQKRATSVIYSKIERQGSFSLTTELKINSLENAY